MDQIIAKIWNPNPFAAKIKMFVAGGGVLWMPVTIQGDRIKTPDRIFATGIGRNEIFGWLASRQPPLSRGNTEARGLTNALRIDVTQQLFNALEKWRNGVPLVTQVLYDCRFLLHFNIEKIPGDLAGRLLRNETRIMIYPSTRWYWPKVVEEQDGTTEVLHSKIGDDHLRPLFPNKMRDSNDHVRYWVPKEVDVSSQWIKIEWIRSLGAI